MKKAEKSKESNKKQFDFRKMSFYQIWIRSFCDGNGDGIGDLYGVYDKLEYIKSLGVDGIWFSPIYPSPNADYGYDISNYKDIHPDYGTLEQFKKVLDRAHELGLKVLLDLVINHTSDEHPWFIESCKGKDNPYSDYYIWRDPHFKGETKLPPNNWYSQFEGLAWEYNEQRGQYYLHVFAKKQPDLNMDNPKVREEVKNIMRFWLDLGVDGFREDVINFISKVPELPNGWSFVPAINGLPFYKDGPNLCKYLQEFRDVALEYGAVQIGEAPFTSVKTALTYIGGRHRVLDMLIQFDTILADCFMTVYVYHGFRLRKLKRAFGKWQYGLQGRGSEPLREHTVLESLGFDAGGVLYFAKRDALPVSGTGTGNDEYCAQFHRQISRCGGKECLQHVLFVGIRRAQTGPHPCLHEGFGEDAGAVDERPECRLYYGQALVLCQPQLHLHQCADRGAGSAEYPELLQEMSCSEKEEQDAAAWNVQGVFSAEQQDLYVRAKVYRSGQRLGGEDPGGVFVCLP